MPRLFNMQNKVIRLYNISFDRIRYSIFRINLKKKLNEKDFLSDNNGICVVLCKGYSLVNFLESQVDFDLVILINFDSSLRKFSTLFEKIGNKPVIIISSNDEHILNYRTRRKLNICSVYNRISIESQSQFRKLRIRRRLEAYGRKVDSLFNHIDNNTLENDIQNTGLAGIHFASLYFKEIHIYGLDFYSSSYLTGGQIDFTHLKRKKGFDQDGFGSFLFNNFLKICRRFKNNLYILHTTYSNYDKLEVPNLKLRQVRFPSD
jgi:hypothetical protein